MTEGSPLEPRAPEERPGALEGLPSPDGSSRSPEQGPAPGRRVPGEPRAPGERRASFAHASEAELSRILDYYQVRWEYEPRSFPILWTLEGKVVESFAPDFYLPDLDLYVELTTLKQTLVRKKNRKLRRLRELYPEIRIKLFYAKDFRALMLKYGKIALAAELSGAGGQFGLPDAVLAVRTAVSQTADRSMADSRTAPAAGTAKATAPAPGVSTAPARSPAAKAGMSIELPRSRRRSGTGRAVARKAIRPARES